MKWNRCIGQGEHWPGEVPPPLSGGGSHSPRYVKTSWDIIGPGQVREATRIWLAPERGEASSPTAGSTCWVLARLAPCGPQHQARKQNRPNSGTCHPSGRQLVLPRGRQRLGPHGRLFYCVRRKPAGSGAGGACRPRGAGEAHCGTRLPNRGHSGTPSPAGQSLDSLYPPTPIRGSTLPGVGDGSVGLPGSSGFTESNGEASREGLFLLLVFLIILVLILIEREHKNPS